MQVKRRHVMLVVVWLLTATAGLLVALSRADHEVDFGSVVEVWADIIRDVDRVGLTITRIPPQREMEIGREIEKEVAKRYWRLKDDPVPQGYVAAVGHALSQQTQRRAIAYRFYIINASMINAFALPGGGIYITTGMLNILESEAELAAILGHEISHVDLRHCIERLQYELAARKIVGRDLAMIARIGYMLVGLGFSEQQELEADAGGVILAAKAKYYPGAGMAVFERLAKVESDRREVARKSGGNEAKKPTLMVEELATGLGKALEQYFATHPPWEKRIGELKQVSERHGRSWREQKFFYVGRSNYRDQIPRTQIEEPDEWQELSSQ